MSTDVVIIICLNYQYAIPHALMKISFLKCKNSEAKLRFILAWIILLLMDLSTFTVRWFISYKLVYCKLWLADCKRMLSFRSEFETCVLSLSSSFKFEFDLRLVLVWFSHVGSNMSNAIIQHHELESNIIGILRCTCLSPETHFISNNRNSTLRLLSWVCSLKVKCSFILVWKKA